MGIALTQQNTRCSFSSWESCKELCRMESTVSVSLRLRSSTSGAGQSDNWAQGMVLCVNGIFLQFQRSSLSACWPDGSNRPKREVSTEAKSSYLPVAPGTVICFHIAPVQPVFFLIARPQFAGRFFLLCPRRCLQHLFHWKEWTHLSPADQEQILNRSRCCHNYAESCCTGIHQDHCTPPLAWLR